MKANEDIVGKTIQGYKIIKALGQGQYSYVYHVERLSDHIHCALKILKEFDSMSEADKEKCFAEVKLLQSLNHPGIIRYLDSFILDNQLYIAIEWADKGDLKKLLRRHEQENEKLDEIKIFEYINVLASALQHMHNKRIIHRDLKPANILYFSEGVKVGDLGLGRYISDSSCMAYSRVGTPLYMAPEVITNVGYSFSSDVWSLGCVLYELITLKSPFKTDEKINLTELFNKIHKAEYRKLDEKTCCKVLCSLVDRMLQPKPQNRIKLEEVISITDNYLKENKNTKPKFEIYTIAEDIQEKLKIIDYEINFCKKVGYSVTRYSFTDYTDSVDQFKQFYELLMWIVLLIKNKINPDQSHLIDINKIRYIISEGLTKVDYRAKLINEFKQLGIDLLDEEAIIKGYGDSCIIGLTQILDKYLILINFTFLNPIYPNKSKLRSMDKISKIQLNVDDEFFNERNSFVSTIDETKLSPNNHLCKEQKSNLLIRKKSLSFNEHNWIKELVNVNDKLEKEELIIYKSIENKPHFSTHRTFISESNLHILSDYIEKESDKQQNIRLKEASLVNKENNILLMFSRSLPKIKQLETEQKNLRSLIEDKTALLNKLSNETVFLNSKINTKLHHINYDMKKHLQQAVEKLNTELLQNEIKSALINSSILKSYKKQIKEKEFEYYQKNNDLNVFDEII